ncbi:MAG TPA: FGGY family carbohydrate kinase [Anaeromyxobacter sp.]|nr:FGGY family carbohydrate kinase [Anaeromyxobacter sp.]
MAESCVIGVDIGTQGTRAALHGLDGALLSEADEASNLVRPGPGMVEEDPERQFGSACRTIRACLEKAGVDPARVAAVAIDGQMAGIIGVGEDGRAVTPYDSWLDTRCAPCIDEMQRRAGAVILSRTGNVPSINHGPKILWWLSERPEVYARVEAFVQPGGYAAMRLCGLSGGEAFIDDTYLHFSGFARNQLRRWDHDLCAEFEVDVNKLPRIASPLEVVGKVSAEAASASGLKPGTPVAAGLGDTAASFLACGAVEPGICVDVAGTASVFAATVPDFAPDMERGILGCGRSAVPGLWHPYAYINGGGLNLNWFVDQLASTGAGEQRAGSLAEAVARLDAEIAGMEPRLDDPYFIPHMEGRVMPSTPHMRGAWFGLTRAHGLGRLYRSLLEGVALEYALYRDAVLALHPGLGLKELRATGGGARDATWNAIKAEVLDLPLLAVQRGGGAPMGAALVAAKAAGAVADLAASARSWVRLGSPVRPTGAHRSLHRARVARYGALLTALAGLSREPDRTPEESRP